MENSMSGSISVDYVSHQFSKTADAVLVDIYDDYGLDDADNISEAVFKDWYMGFGPKEAYQGFASPASIQQVQNILPSKLHLNITSL